MVPSDWDSAPMCICGPNFISDLIGESPFFPAARLVLAASRQRDTRGGPRVLAQYADTRHLASVSTY